MLRKQNRNGGARQALSKWELDHGTASIAASSIVYNSFKRDEAAQFQYGGLFPAGTVEVRDAFFDRAFIHTTMFDSHIAAIAMHVLARKSDGTNVRQFPVLFTSSSNPHVFAAGVSLVVKLSFLTGAGATQDCLKVEVGSVADFAGSTQDVWVSSQPILDATLRTEYTNGTLYVDIYSARILLSQ